MSLFLETCVLPGDCKGSVGIYNVGNCMEPATVSPTMGDDYIVHLKVSFNPIRVSCF